jgi:hypothetical protein
MEAILSGVDWNSVLKTVGSAAAVVAILAFLAQVIVKHLLARDVETYKARVKSRSARNERIRQEVTRWANPIRGAVGDLEHRLANILKDYGYVALSSDKVHDVHANWHITYEYFFPSTIFLFAQYFCWIRLLEENLSFELFEKNKDKDNFLRKVYDVEGTLGGFPLDELKKLHGEGDCQVFNLEQRALGEALIVKNGDPRCMRFSEFADKWGDLEFRRRFDPLTRFIDCLDETHKFRWKRLELMAAALERLRSECDRLLGINPPWTTRIRGWLWSRKS